MSLLCRGRGPPTTKELGQRPARRGQLGWAGARPCLAGIIVATAGAGWAIAIDSATYAASAACLLRLNIPAHPPSRQSPVLAQLAGGWREFRSRTSGTLTFAADGQDTLMSWDWQVRPKGWLRLLGPLTGPLGGRMEHKIWTGLKHQLEGEANASPA